MAGLVACDTIIRTLIDRLLDAGTNEKQELIDAMGNGITASQVLAALNDCAGAPLQEGTRVATCEDLNTFQGNPDSPLSYKVVLLSKVGPLITGRIYGPQAAYVRAVVTDDADAPISTWPSDGSTTQITAAGYTSFSIGLGADLGDKGLIRFYGGATAEVTTVVDSDAY